MKSFASNDFGPCVSYANWGLDDVDLDEETAKSYYWQYEDYEVFLRKRLVEIVDYRPEPQVDVMTISLASPV